MKVAKFGHTQPLPFDSFSSPARVAYLFSRDAKLAESRFRHLAPESSMEALVGRRGWRGFGSAGGGEPGDYHAAAGS